MSDDVVEKKSALTAQCQPLTCQECSIHRGGVCLSGEGNIHSPIMLVGNCLGTDDVTQKKIFVGKSGNYLNYLLTKSGIKREEIYLTNTLKGFVKPGSTVPSVAIKKCWQYLEAEIKELKPKVIILMGTASYKNFQGKAVPGTQYFDETYNCWLVLTHHPMKPLYTGNPETEEEIVTALKVAKSLINQASTRLQPPTVTTIRTLEELQTALPLILANTEYGVDCETTGVNIEQDRVLTIGLSNRIQTYGIIVKPDMIPILQTIFTQIGVVGQHSKFDVQMLRKLGVDVKKVIFDDMLAHYVLDPLGSHGLDSMSLKYLGTSFSKSDIAYDELYKDGITDAILEILVVRGAQDAFLHYALKEIFSPQIESQGFHKYYYDLLLPISEMLTEMEYNGILIDKDKLYEVEVSLDYQLKSVGADFLKEPIIIDYLKKEKLETLNLRSPKQMSTLLYKYMKIPQEGKSKTTDREYLEFVNQGLQNPVIEKLLQYRNLTKLRDTYVKGIRKVLDQSKSGRIHVDYHQTTTITGRLSASNPNLQTIPKIVGHAHDIRQVFVASPGYTIVEMDFRQLEFRVWAHLSRDKNMIQMIDSGKDIHVQVAADVFNKPEDQVTEEERYMAKYLDFGLIYGRGIKSVSQQFKVTLDRAQKLKDDFFRAFPEATLWLQQAATFGLKNKYVSTPFGRKIPVEFNPQDENLVAAARRHAVNYPIQGTAADITNLTGVFAHRLITQAGLTCRILLNVHDALYWEVQEDQIDQLKQLCLQAIQEITQYISFRTKLEVEFKKGKNLAEQEKM